MPPNRSGLRRANISGAGFAWQIRAGNARSASMRGVLETAPQRVYTGPRRLNITAVMPPVQRFARIGNRADRRWRASLADRCLPLIRDVKIPRSAVMLVRDTGIEPVTSSVSGKRSPAELIARALIRRWRRESNPCARLCRPLPHHSATPPLGFDASCTFERMTGFEPATLTLAR